MLRWAALARRCRSVVLVVRISRRTGCSELDADLLTGTSDPRDLLDSGLDDLVSRLRRSAEGRSVPLSGVQSSCR